MHRSIEFIGQTKKSIDTETSASTVVIKSVITSGTTNGSQQNGITEQEVTTTNKTTLTVVGRIANSINDDHDKFNERSVK